MPTIVYFATNRLSTAGNFGNGITAPSDPTAITYGVAEVDGISAATNGQGRLAAVAALRGGDWGPIADQIDADRKNVLVFVHGFDNGFEDAITRAALNREWLAQAGPAAGPTDMTVVAFAWPSLGRVADLPVPWRDYQRDQVSAQQSGFHLMTFLSRLDPVLQGVRAAGGKAVLLAHSMGTLALQAAVESWFTHGNGPDEMFDEAILAASDVSCDAFAYPLPSRLSGLDQLARRVSIYHSEADQVLHLSTAVNLGARRLGLSGPVDRTDQTRFPPGRWRFVDCAGVRYPHTFMGSHQYYRTAPAVRADIAATLAAGAP